MPKKNIPNIFLKAKFISWIFPNCACESHSLNKYSPGPVTDTELLSRFAFSPIHIGSKGVKASLFSHAFSHGCSIQRDAFASNQELISWLSSLMRDQPEWSWKKVAIASCSDIRDVRLSDGSKGFCVLDTANETNPSHGEIFQAKYQLDDADQLQLKREIMQAFTKVAPFDPQTYRSGELWNALLPELQTR